MIYKIANTRLIYISICCVIASCNIYSFSGASISEKTKTIEVNYINNEAGLIQPNLSNLLTESLITKCQRETNLEITNTNGDVLFTGTIVHYIIEPIAIENNEIAAKNRLSIAVEINFINKIDNTKSFNKKFTEYIDFNSDAIFTDIEEDLNITIVDNLVEDIFNSAFMNW